MKFTPCVLFASVFLLPVARMFAAESGASFSYVMKDTDLAAVMAADEERVAATLAGDRERLAAIYSDELHYAHSNGTVEDKAARLAATEEGRTVYESYEYRHRAFKPVAPGIVLMTGRVEIQARNASGPVALDLNFLSVWREENGVWRFLAWQSCRNPTTTP